MLNRNEKLSLFEIYGDSISTRDAARKIIEQLLQKSISTIDFDQVKFISRSFAHEFITLLEKLDTEIRVLNKNMEIDQTIALVQKSRQKNSTSKSVNRVEVTDPAFVF